MGIYIKHIKMPKSCKRCPFTCEALQFFNGKGRPQSCPLIEIVRCGECKYWHNHEWSSTCDKNIGNGFPSDYFCADGERRADENSDMDNSDNRTN